MQNTQLEQSLQLQQTKADDLMKQNKIKEEKIGKLVKENQEINQKTNLLQKMLGKENLLSVLDEKENLTQ